MQQHACRPPRTPPTQHAPEEDVEDAKVEKVGRNVVVHLTQAERLAASLQACKGRGEVGQVAQGRCSCFSRGALMFQQVLYSTVWYNMVLCYHHEEVFHIPETGQTVKVKKRTPGTREPENQRQGQHAHTHAPVLLVRTCTIR